MPLMSHDVDRPLELEPLTGTSTTLCRARPCAAASRETKATPMPASTDISMASSFASVSANVEPLQIHARGESGPQQASRGPPLTLLVG